MQRPSSTQGNSANTNSTNEIHRVSELISKAVYPVPPIHVSDSLARASVSARAQASTDNPRWLRWNSGINYIFSSQVQPVVQKPTQTTAETSTETSTRESYSQFLVSNLLTPANNPNNLESLSSKCTEVVDKSYNEGINSPAQSPDQEPSSQAILSNQEVNKEFVFPADSVFQVDELDSDFPADSVVKVSELLLNYTIDPVVSLDDLKRDILTDPVVSLDDAMINFSEDPSVLISNVKENFTDDLLTKEDYRALNSPVKSIASASARAIICSTDLSLAKVRSNDRSIFQTKIPTPASVTTTAPVSFQSSAQKDEISPPQLQNSYKSASVELDQGDEEMERQKNISIKTRTLKGREFFRGDDFESKQLLNYNDIVHSSESIITKPSNKRICFRS